MRDRLLKFSRLQKQSIVALVDVATVFVALCVSLWLRLGEITVPTGDQWFLILLAPLLAVPIFGRFGLYRAVFRYVSIHMGWAILKAVAVLTAVVGLAIYLTGAEPIPRSLILINAFVTFFGVAGTRVLARWIRERVLIYGAGEGGVQLASALAHSRGDLDNFFGRFGLYRAAHRCVSIYMGWAILKPMPSEPTQRELC